MRQCPLCQAEQEKSQTTFTIDLGFGVVVIRHVPAHVCLQCGSEWIEDEDMKKIELIVDSAREKHSIVEVSEFSSAA